MLVRIELTEVAEPSNTLNCKPFFKHCILQIFIHVFLWFTICRTNNFVLKTELYLIYIFSFGLGWMMFDVSGAYFIRSKRIRDLLATTDIN